MGIGKSKITPSINVDDMLKKAESNHELEAEKQDADKLLTEIREAKEALLIIHRNLLDAIKAEGEATVVLQEAISSSNNIINGICNAIVKAEQNTRFKATIKSEHLAQLQQLLSQAIETWKTSNHSIFRHDNFIGCFSADKIKMSARKYFCFNISVYYWCDKIALVLNIIK